MGSKSVNAPQDFRICLLQMITYYSSVLIWMRLHGFDRSWISMLLLLANSLNLRNRVFSLVKTSTLTSRHVSPMPFISLQLLITGDMWEF
ncbi:hypothetical protein LINGRAHAP2_LOCUS30022 [Linum grandiflorum]